MDNEDLLFTNTFVRKVDTIDTPIARKNQFQAHYEVQEKDRQFQELSRKAQYTPEDSRTIEKIERISIIAVDSGKRNKDKNPNQSNFEYFFGKTYYNVKKIKLVSTEIPNTDQVITEQPP